MDLVISPRLEQVSAVREFLESYYGPLLNDPDLICRIAVTAHELLENAAKYSADGQARLRVCTHGDNGSTVLSVSVSSKSAPEHIDELKVTIEELASADDPGMMYIAYLARAAMRTEGSGLGLARIRAEAEMTLHLRFEGDCVCVEAETPLTTRGDT